MDRAKYRVKYNREHEGKGPGEIFEYTEAEAAPFLDKLEPASATPQAVQDKQAEVDQLKLELKAVTAELELLKANKPKEAETVKDTTVQAPGDGLRQDATLEQVKAWLKEDKPSKNQAAVVLQSEKDGKNRKPVVEVLQAYVEEKSK